MSTKVTRKHVTAAYEKVPYLFVTLESGLIGQVPTNKRTIKSLGFQRPKTSVILPNTPAIWGQIFKLGAQVILTPEMMPDFVSDDLKKQANAFDFGRFVTVRPATEEEGNKAKHKKATMAKRIALRQNKD
jgi:ribosomal protein L30/L7E